MNTQSLRGAHSFERQKYYYKKLFRCQTKTPTETTKHLKCADNSTNNKKLQETKRNKNLKKIKNKLEEPGNNKKNQVIQ